ncbi:hypothetical protein [Metabacillus sp. 84]|uniref:hypothetical protein n=1 Tax=unclassified Metabacillus TaxID=2675274 RepID=UPI003CE8C4E6
MKVLKGIWSTFAVMGILALMIGFKHTEVMEPVEKTAVAEEMQKVAARQQAEAKQQAAKEKKKAADKTAPEETQQVPKPASAE